MKVLYINHSSEVSGAERALLELINGLTNDISPVVACPEGALTMALRKDRVPFSAIPELRVGLRWHPWFALKALSDLGRAALSIRRVFRRRQPDLIHANSIRAAFIAALAARRGRLPLVVAVNDCLPDTRVANLARRFIARRATITLANSRYTAERFTRGIPDARTEVIYNPVDLDRFDPARISREQARQRLGVAHDIPLLGVVAQITPWKGQDDAIRALAGVRLRRPAAQLLLIGDTKFVNGSARYDNRAYRRRLTDLIRRLGLDGAVRFLGERTDIPEILRALDLVLVPSWEEPFGLVVIEAMAMESAVLATNAGGPAEIITPGEDGLLLPPRQPDQWAQAAEALLADPQRRAQLGRKARQRVVARFSRRRYVDSVVAQYGCALRRSGGW